MKKKLSLFFIVIAFFNCLSLTAKASEASMTAANLNPINEIVDTSDHIYSYDEMTSDIALLSERYPNYIHFSSLGLSYDNRDIWRIVVGNPDAKKAIYVQASIHGREWMNSMLVMKQLEYICENYNENLFNQICICVLPMVNPDGVTISQFGFEGIRNPLLKENLYKMRGANKPMYWKANANGVDVNRNFSIGFGKGSLKKIPGRDNYNGPVAFSEPETLAVVTAFSSRSFDIAITYHSMEGAVYWNLGQTGEIYDKTLALASNVILITGYKSGKKSPVHGLEYDWMIFEKNTPSVLIETGTVTCPLPYSQWNDIWTRNGTLLLQLAYLYV